tara:strand:+ start:1324 stop:1737 length:414 start_codon:yes stop_codon:yes gene_type:complete
MLNKLLSFINNNDKNEEIKVNNNKKIKNNESDKSFFLYTDKNTPLVNLISNEKHRIKIVNILSNNKVKGVININNNFLKFNIIIENKEFVSIKDIYIYITKKNDLEYMLDNFNNNNYFINIIINEIDKKNNLLCNID